jgi:hypothetical protein
MNWGGTILGSLAGGGLGGLIGSGALGGGGGSTSKAIMGALAGGGLGGLAGASGMPATTSGVAGMLPSLMMAKQGQQPAMQPQAGQFGMPQTAQMAQYGAGSPGYQNALAQALAQYQG